jgi:hypothetical protein
MGNIGLDLTAVAFIAGTLVLAWGYRWMKAHAFILHRPEIEAARCGFRNKATGKICGRRIRGCLHPFGVGSTWEHLDGTHLHWENGQSEWVEHA